MTAPVLALNACGCGRGLVYEFGRPAEFCAECATDRVRFSKRLSMRLRRGSRQWYKPDAPPPLRSVLNGQRYRARLLAELLHGTLSEIAERYYAAPWLYALVIARPHGAPVCASHRGAAK